MAKDNERKLAKQLFMQGKSQKEIAILVSVQEKTVASGLKNRLEIRT